MIGDRARTVARTVPTLTRVVALAATERLRRDDPDDPQAVPTSAERASRAWMTGALCRGVTGARVVEVRPGDGSSGTTYRRRLHVEYNDAGRAAGLPATVFTKSTPGLRHRIMQAITGAVEARFYTQLRPQLDIEAPVCFHGVVDDQRMMSITVIEDLVATKNATFMTPTETVTREMASQIVALLADVHGTFASQPAPAFVKTYQRIWSDALGLANIKRYFVRAFSEGGDYFAPEIRTDANRAWDAVLRSIKQHDALQPTVIHNDVHLGNWYRTGDTNLGLCDWQGIAYGHWSRDLAYALSTTLTVDDRRAWEHDLVVEYVDRLASRAQTTVVLADAWMGYRSQLWGALAFWAPTYSPPRLLPSDMQPREISGEMLHRISTACADHDSFAAVGA
jgi:aminoglycoside phosphotransferase (APT) family kinase protein